LQAFVVSRKEELEGEKDGNLKVNDHHHIQSSSGQLKAQATTKEERRFSRAYFQEPKS